MVSRSRWLRVQTNDGGNINYTNAINSNLVFDIPVSLNRFVQERRPAELFDPATLGFTATSLAAMRGLPVHTSSHDSEPRCHKAHSIDVGFDQIRLERRAYSSLLHGIGAAYYHAGCRQSYVEMDTTSVLSARISALTLTKVASSFSMAHSRRLPPTRQAHCGMFLAATCGVPAWHPNYGLGRQCKPDR